MPSYHSQMAEHVKELVIKGEGSFVVDLDGIQAEYPFTVERSGPIAVVTTKGNRWASDRRHSMVTHGSITVEKLRKGNVMLNGVMYWPHVASSGVHQGKTLWLPIGCSLTDEAGTPLPRRHMTTHPMKMCLNKVSLKGAPEVTLQANAISMSPILALEDDSELDLQGKRHLVRISIETGSCSCFVGRNITATRATIKATSDSHVEGIHVTESIAVEASTRASVYVSKLATVVTKQSCDVETLVQIENKTAV